MCTAGISNVESIMYGDKKTKQNKKTMVNVKLSKEMRKDVIIMLRAWNKEKMSP